MFGRNKKSYAGERVIVKTRPRIFLHCKSVIIKLLIALVLIYYFQPIVSFAGNLQMELLNYAQIPLVRAVVTVIVLLVLLLIFWSVWNLVSWSNIEYRLTSHRVIIEKGVFRKKRAYVHYENIEDVTIYQSFLERIFASGDIELYSGHENTQIILENVPNPEKLEVQTNQLMEGNFTYKKRRRPSKLQDRPKKKLTFSDPEYWESEEANEAQLMQKQNYAESKDYKRYENVEQTTNEKFTKPEKHIMERHSDKFKRR